MDSEIHREQASKYLIDPLKRWLTETSLSAFVGGNSFVYYGYNVANKTSQVLGPDFYVVMGGEARGQKKWVIWEEGGRMPSLVVELVSPSTEARDRGEKFLIYRDVLKTKDYFLFNSDTGRLEGFHLLNGVYVTAEYVNQGAPLVGENWIRCRGIDLWLGVVDGWLRWFDPKKGNLVFTDQELAESANQRAEEAEAELRSLREQLAQLQKPPAT